MVFSLCQGNNSQSAERSLVRAVPAPYRLKLRCHKSPRQLFYLPFTPSLNSSFCSTETINPSLTISTARLFFTFYFKHYEEKNCQRKNCHDALSSNQPARSPPATGVCTLFISWRIEEHSSSRVRNSRAPCKAQPKVNPNPNQNVQLRRVNGSDCDQSLPRTGNTWQGQEEEI